MRKTDFLLLAMLLLAAPATALETRFGGPRQDPETSPQRPTPRLNWKARKVAEVQANARAGDPGAQHDLGLLYETGLFDTPRDLEKSRMWYEMAADQGHAKAKGRLGGMYLTGEGVERDDAKGLEFLSQAAEGGDPDSHLFLGHRFLEQDPDKGIQHIRTAAELGNGEAQRLMGAYHMEGKYVPRDTTEAERWLKMIAPKDVTGVFLLGKLHAERGDTVEAYAWFLVSSKEGLDPGEDTWRDLKNRMTQEEIARAVERAGEIQRSRKNPQ